MVAGNLDFKEVHTFADTCLESTTVEIFLKLRYIHVTDKFWNEMSDQTRMMIHWRLLEELDDRISLFMVSTSNC